MRRKPEWRHESVVLVPNPRPTARLRAVNERARQATLKPGMVYSVALSLVPGLRSGIVTEEECAQAREELLEQLHQFSPEVEPGEQSGVYWLNAEGLQPLFPSLEDWGARLLSFLEQQGWWAALAVGFERFMTLALAKLQERGCHLLEDPEEEWRHAQEVPLRYLDLPENLLQSLEPLGVYFLGDLLKLPAHGLRERFGNQVFALHQAARGRRYQPLRPLSLGKRYRRGRAFEAPLGNNEAILALVQELLRVLLSELHHDGKEVMALILRLVDEEGEECQHRLTLGQPTLEEGVMLQLVRLRLEGARMSCGVVEVELETLPRWKEQEQLELFEGEFCSHSLKRDPKAANLALARVRSELGEQAVVWAKLEPGALPEESYSWQPLDFLQHPGSGRVEYQPCRVRRFFARRQRWPQPRSSLRGPFRLSGGWWHEGFFRDYYYGLIENRGANWICYDHLARCWFRQGRVE